MASKQLLVASQVTVKSHSHFLFTIRYNQIDRNQTLLKKCNVKGNRGDTIKIEDDDFFICSLKVFIKRTRGIKKAARVEYHTTLLPFQNFFLIFPYKMWRTVTEIRGLKEKTCYEFYILL